MLSADLPADVIPCCGESSRSTAEGRLELSEFDTTERRTKATPPTWRGRADACFSDPDGTVVPRVLH